MTSYIMHNILKPSVI